MTTFRQFLETIEDQSKIKKLADQLQFLDLNQYSVLGHGTTSEDIAKKIAKEGLKYSDPNLDRQAIAVFNMTEPIDQQPENLNRLLNWMHKNSRFVVLLGIPNKPENIQRGGEHYFNSAWEEIPPEERQELSTVKWKIPPHYIIGWINANDATFHPNNQFDPSIPVKVKPTTSLLGPRSRIPKTPNRQIPMPHRQIPIPQAQQSNDLEIW